MAKKKPDARDKFAGMRLRQQRQHLGLSQTQVADPLGLTFQQIQKYEKGVNRMGASRLQQVAQILQVPVTFFFEDANLKQVPSAITEVLATADGINMLTAYAKIKSTAMRRQVCKLVELMAG